MFTMPMAPLVLNSTSGDWMWTAASALGLRSQGLEFDPDLVNSDEFGADGSDADQGDGLSMLERYVSRLLDASFRDSSLFWHYAMRHVPTPSLACARDEQQYDPPSKGSPMAVVNDIGLPDAEIRQHIPSEGETGTGIPAFGYDAFPLGGVGSTCLCGWEKQNSRCIVPANICSDLGIPPADCWYDDGNQDEVTGRILDAWPLFNIWEGALPLSNGTWRCPYMDLSDAWGIVSADDADAWIRGDAAARRLTVSSLLRAGRAGLRMGNARTLGESARREGVWPSERVEQLPRKDSGGLGRCSDTILSTFDPVSVAKEVVDDLFPIAQGVHESAPVSFCLRFAIEFSRLRMLRAIDRRVRASGDGGGGTVATPPHLRDELMLQKSVVDSWRGKCESQLNMLAVCKGNGLFEVIPEIEVPYDCPFVIQDAYADPVSKARRYYVTPNGGCMLFHAGSFYDPCRNTAKPCTMDPSSGAKVSLTLADITGPAQRDNTLVRFDVRSAGSGEILGSWPVKFYDIDEAKNGVASQLVEMVLRWKATTSSSSPQEQAMFEEENAGMFCFFGIACVCACICVWCLVCVCVYVFVRLPITVVLKARGFWRMNRRHVPGRQHARGKHTLAAQQGVHKGHAHGWSERAKGKGFGGQHEGGTAEQGMGRLGRTCHGRQCGRVLRRHRRLVARRECIRWWFYSSQTLLLNFQTHAYAHVHTTTASPAGLVEARGVPGHSPVFQGPGWVPNV
jgi:hypothetical protein